MGVIVEKKYKQTPFELVRKSDKNNRHAVLRVTEVQRGLKAVLRTLGKQMRIVDELLGKECVKRKIRKKRKKNSDKNNK